MIDPFGWEDGPVQIKARDIVNLTTCLRDFDPECYGFKLICSWRMRNQ
jgi:hypothetical protein